MPQAAKEAIATIPIAFVAGVDPVEVRLVAQHEPARWQHHGRTQPSHSYSESLAAAGVQFVRAKCEVSPEDQSDQLSFFFDDGDLAVLHLIAKGQGASDPQALPL